MYVDVILYLNMNWSYISGFFDADGSVTIVINQRNENKTIQMSFHNCEKEILEKIQKFIYKDIGANGSISLKKTNNDNHSDAYDLRYYYKQALSVANKLTVYHPKKKHRINIYRQIQECTTRNGKYTEEQIAKRLSLEKLFFMK